MTSSALRLLAAAAASAALAGCASNRVPDSVDNARTPTERFAAEVTSRPEEIRLAVHAQGLSANQADALAAFVDTWRQSEGGPVRIQTPSGSGADAAAVYRTADGARARLVAEGVPERMIDVAGYDAAGKADAPLVIGFLHYQVSLPSCGQKWTNMAHSAGNQVQPNFGCAVTANMAAQIANPADLVGAQVMGPSDAGRRETVLEKYRKGEVTSAATDEKANGSVSNAVK